jgi:hypothetical protein
VLALDSSQHITTLALQNVGIPLDNILLIEQLEDVAASHRQAKIPCHHGSIGSMANTELNPWYYQYPSNYYTCLPVGLWFDTCNTIAIAGEVLALLKVLQLTDGTVLAFTFTKAHISTENHLMGFETFLFDLRQLVEARGLFLHPEVTSLPYSGDGNGGRGSPMIFYMVKIVKDEPLYFGK